MSLEGIFEQEFDKLKLRKIKLKTDPKKPLLPYEGFILKEAPVPFKDPGTTLRSKTGGFLSKVGQAYQDLEASSEKFKKFGEGDLSVLKDVGISMLEKQLDLDTNKVSVFGKKGYDLVEYTLGDEITTEGVNQMMEDLINVFEAGPTGNRQTWSGLKPGQEIKRNPRSRTPKHGKVQDVPDYGPWHRLNWLVRDEKTGRFRKIERKDVPPEFIPGPPGPGTPGPGDTKPEPEPKPNVKRIKLLLKIVKKDSATQAGVPYVLIPANEETKQIMQEKNLSYAKFVKHIDTQSQVENATILDNSGKIHFYNLENKYVPEFSETVNYVYKSPYYRMGPHSPRELIIMFDPVTGAPVTTPAKKGTPPPSSP